MKITIYQLRLCNIVFNCIFLIMLCQSCLAGLELLFDGKKFFYRANGKDIPVDLSPGAEIARFQEELNYPSPRKTREIFDYAKSGGKLNNDFEEVSNSWCYSDESSVAPIKDLGTKIVENEFGGMVKEVQEEDHPTRYDLLASMTNNIDIEKPEERIDAIISLIKEDLDRHFNKDKNLHV